MTINLSLTGWVVVLSLFPIGALVILIIIFPGGTTRCHEYPQEYELH